MRIPLDYYRILGLPIQATVEQLQQAHADRTLQLPRREFSEAAIETRRQLIDEAYAVLSDPGRRQDYDASFLAKSYELLEVGKSSEFFDEQGYADEPAGYAGSDPSSPDSYSPNIDIQDEQFIGALIILQELGEYELVLKLSRPYLDGSNLALKQGRLGDPDLVLADVVMTAALSCLELGREQWQQGQYENAADSLKMGQDLLLQEGLFPSLRGEMQSDLYKLRPYRILELVALPESQDNARYQGLDLLGEMLQDRGGIDGNGDDQSGLSVDDFLRFIQQLRSYLTAAEQQTLFEAESRRPSAVAIYLAVYSLLARGFAERQPALIRRAKGMLLRLGTRQDVHLEQAVCSLLLGQTEEASRALELSQEFESLAFIREHSQGSPDLLPGLCLYSERWLQDEVFPHFRDLAYRQASLKEYFADEDVQSYLEELPNEPEPAPSWAAHRSGFGDTYRQPVERSTRSHSRLQTLNPRTTEPRIAGMAGMAATTAATIHALDAPPTMNGAGYGDNRGEDHAVAPTHIPPGSRGDRPRSTNGRTGGTPTRRGGGRSLRIDRVLILAALGAGVILLLYFISRLFARPQPAPVAGNGTPQVEQLEPVLSEVIPSQTQAIGANEPLDETNAAAVIDNWLAAKSAAMGQGRQTNRLSEILTDPALSRWQEQAQQVEAANSYWEYQHSDVEIVEVEVLSDESATEGTDLDGASPGQNTASEAVPQEAFVEAIVSERGHFYSDGQFDQTSSYDSTLRVRYNLVRVDDEWRIQGWQVLE
ncbi:IMS domain-containing protein [Egbenema bharatensis]|uniref:IMS domain-containing protein n=1 Tax=Egbenema bharatensis TaxID=3463334 RepID=UPI003A848548